VADIKKALNAILYFVDEEYKTSHPDTLERLAIRRGDLDEFMPFATANKLSYYFCKRVLEECPELSSEVIRSVVDQGERHFVKVRRTLEFISTVFNKENLNFLVIKTFKNIPYVTQDIDISVKSETLSNAEKALENNGAKKVGTKLLKAIIQLGLGSPDYGINDLLTIDLYRNIPWPGLLSFDEGFLWRNPRTVNSHEGKYLIPNYEADFLLIIESALLTDGTITLLDFLYINSLLKKNLDFDELQKQTSRYGWKSPFREAISILKAIKKAIYQGDYVPESIKFPYVFPLRVILRALSGQAHVTFLNHPMSLPQLLTRIGFHCFFGRIYADAINVKRKFGW